MSSVSSARPLPNNRVHTSGVTKTLTPYLRSVRTPILLAIILSVVVPAALVTVISSVVNINNATDRAYDQMQTVSTLKTSQIGFWVNLLEGELSTIATNDEHLLLVRQAEPNSSFPTLREPAQEELDILYRSLIRETVEFTSLNLIAGNGDFIVGMDSNILFQPVDNPQDGEVIIFGPTLDEATSQLNMSAWYPVFDNGRFLAYMGGEVDTTSLFSILQDETGTGDDIETFLVDEQGHVIISDEAVFEHNNHNFVLGETTVQLPDNLELNPNGVNRLSNFGSYVNESTFAVADNSLPIDTILITQQSQGSVLNATYFSMIASAAATFAIIVIVLVLGIFFIERRIVRPVKQLSTTANQIADGNLSQRVSVNRLDEIGILATSFNTMTDQLANSIDTLELRIQERTADLVAARDRAEQADNAKSAFLASTSHELRTPLNAVINYTKLISSGHWGQVTSEQVSALETISKNGRYLLNLINDLLDMSKIASGSLEIYKSEVDLNAEINATIKIMEGLHENDQVEFITDIAPDLPNIIGDGIRIRQIMINLASNAFKFTDAGHVRLTAFQQDGHFYFEVEDTGMGIKPEDYDAVFTPFQQTESGRLKGKGTGLGMSISQSLTEALGGKLWFESVYGEGSTFYLQLPLNTESDAIILADQSNNR